MRSKLLLLQTLVLLCSAAAQAQNVGVGTTTPAASAALDVSSTNKGILIPRMTTAQRDAIASPANGLMVYDTDYNAFWVAKSGTWNMLLSLPGAAEANTPDPVLEIMNTGNVGQAIFGHTEGHGTGVEGFSSDGNGGRFRSLSGDSAAVYGQADAGPGGEFKSATGPAVRARGNIDIVKSRLRFSGDPSAGLVQGIEFTNSNGTALNGFLGKYNDSMMGFYGYTGAGWKMLFNNTNGNLGLQGNTNPRNPLSFSNSIGDKISIYDNGNGTHYGIGLQAAQLQLYVPSAAQDIVLGYGSSAAFTENMRIRGNGNVGIGTTVPTEKLQVNGNTKIGGTLQVQGGNPGAGKVLTSDATGIASWQAPAAVMTPVGFVADKSGNDVILPTNSGWVKIPFNTSGNYVVGTAYNSTNSEFTVPANGLYAFDVKLLFNGFAGTTTNTGGVYIAIYIRDAGNTFAYSVYEYTFIPSVSTYFTQGFSTTINLAAGSIIDVRVGNGSNGAITVTGQLVSGLRTHFSGYRVL